MFRENTLCDAETLSPNLKIFFLYVYKNSVFTATQLNLESICCRFFRIIYLVMFAQYECGIYPQIARTL